MNIIAWDKENGLPVEPQRPPHDGEWCRVDSGGFVEIKMWYAPTVDESPSESVERDWVSSELSRTDNLVTLPDYPYTDKLITYRAELRNYSFDGDRPVAPTTQNGTSI